MVAQSDYLQHVETLHDYQTLLQFLPATLCRLTAKRYNNDFHAKMRQ